jgi:hypothetical protein
VSGGAYSSASSGEGGGGGLCCFHQGPCWWPCLRIYMSLRRTDDEGHKGSHITVG